MKRTEAPAAVQEPVIVFDATGAAPWDEDDAHPPAIVRAYRLIRTSLTERQLVTYTIQGDRVLDVQLAEPDVGRIVLAKLLIELQNSEERERQ